MGEVCEGPWVFSVTYWQNLDPRGLAATQGCEVKGNTNGTSSVLSFWSKSLTGSENAWTRWGEGKEEARDPLSKQILLSKVLPTVRSGAKLTLGASLPKFPQGHI